MNEVQVGLLAIGVTLTLALAGSIVAVAKIAIELGKQRERVDIMWAFLKRRALSEVVHKDLGDLNSPFTIREEVVNLVKGFPVAESMVEYYNGLSKKPSDSEAMLLLEKNFGPRILREICLNPAIGLTYGACLPIALAVAKNSNVIHI